MAAIYADRCRVSGENQAERYDAGLEATVDLIAGGRGVSFERVEFTPRTQDMAPKVCHQRSPHMVLGGLLMAGLMTSVASAASYTEIHLTGGADGAQPMAGVVSDRAGNLYGEDFNGAVVCQAGVPYGCGAVYKISPQGRRTALVTFTGPNGRAGSNPLTLVGNRLYGTVDQGDTTALYGLVFSVNTDGSDFTILHRFSPDTGYNPSGQLRVMANGIIYGTTVSGGNMCDFCAAGVLFELQPDGTYTVLHNFTPDKPDSAPAQIFVAANGTIYGSTRVSMKNGIGGTLYQFSPSTGVYKTLHTFYTQVDGSGPILGGITQGNELYGATYEGGSVFSAGTLFEFGRNGFKRFIYFRAG